MSAKPVRKGFCGGALAICSICYVICFCGCKLRSFQARLDSRNPPNGQAVSRKVSVTRYFSRNSKKGERKNDEAIPVELLSVRRQCSVRRRNVRSVSR